MDVGLKIKQLREEKNLSQEELGAAIGVSKQMISHYENGENTPRFKTLEKIAVYFNVDPSELLTSKNTSTVNESVPAYGKIEKLERENEALKKELNELKDKLIQILLNQKK
jgi:transcriptional regulator with XRE-family HTH domain